MFGFFPLSIILQAFCIYHAYTNKADQKWFFIIIFLPLIGSGLYLYHHFYNRQNITKVSEGFKEVVNTNYSVQKLEKEVKFSDTITNKTNLADKYLELGRYQEAADLYESCLEGFNADNADLLRRLVKVHYLLENYGKSVAYGHQVNGNKTFSKSKEKIAYAWSLFYENEEEKAEKVFSEMDSTFTNYPHRMEFAKFLNESGKREDALSKLEELMDEYDHMEAREKRQNRAVNRDIVRLYGEIKKGG